MIYEEGGYEKEADSIGDFRSDSFMPVHIAGFPYASGKGRLCRRQYHVWFGCGKIPGCLLYTSSSHLPVGYTEDIFDALDIQDELQTLYTSGTVFHAFLGEKLPGWQSAAALVRKIAENYKLPYYTMSPTYSICKNHGYLTGEQYTCPECGEKMCIRDRLDSIM